MIKKVTREKYETEKRECVREIARLRKVRKEQAKSGTLTIDTVKWLSYWEERLIRMEQYVRDHPDCIIG